VLSTRDIDLLLRSVGIKLVKKDLVARVKEVDAEGMGRLGFDNVLVLLTSLFATRDQLSSLTAAFAVFDHEDSGFIMATDLHAIMCGFGDAVEEDEATQIVKMAKKDADGRVDYKAFAAAIVETLHLKKAKKKRRKKTTEKKRW
jgi:calmodulin